MKEQILQLRKEGLSYREIEKELGCARSTISYHCGKDQRKKNLERQRKRRLTINRKLETSTWHFKNKAKSFNYCRPKVETKTLTVKEAKEVLQEQNYKCYITGESISIDKDIHFDHKIPISKGGLSTKENLGICTRQANLAKSDMTLEELIEFCKIVLNNFGYIIKNK